MPAFRHAKWGIRNRRPDHEATVMNIGAVSLKIQFVVDYL